MSYTITEIDELPPSIKGGNRKPSQETLDIQEKIKTMRSHKIVGEFSDNEINALTQRVRTAGERIGIKVKIRSIDGGFAFQGKEPEKATKEKGKK